MNKFDLDDKDLAIVAITLIALCSVFVIETPSDIVTQALIALGALAIGRKKD